jgi:plasmid stabilization system protein ParE
MRTVRLDPEAEQELRDAAAHYAGRSRKVARRFLANVVELSRVIAEHPHRFPVLARPGNQPALRRALVRGFPYAIVFLPADDRVSILAVAHFRRASGYWLHRVRDAE